MKSSEGLNKKVKLIIFIILMLILTTLGTYSHLKNGNVIKDVNISNTKLYPSYSNDVKGISAST